MLSKEYMEISNGVEMLQLDYHGNIIHPTMFLLRQETKLSVVKTNYFYMKEQGKNW